MKTNTTILLAFLIGAGAAAQNAHAYNVAAPPEIRACVSAIHAIADEVSLFGNGCYYGFLLQTDNIDDCRKYDAAIAEFQRESDIYQAWLNEQMDKGATRTDVDITQSIRRISDMHDKIHRAIKYGAK